MKHHIKRFWWAYAALAALLIWPAAVWRMQQLPPLDLPSARRVTEAMDREFTRRYGPAQFDQFNEIARKFTPADSDKDENEERVWSFSQFWPIAGAPAVAPELARALALYGEPIAHWNALSRSARYAHPFTRVLDHEQEVRAGKYQGVMYVHADLLPIQRSQTVALARAIQAIATRDWDAALARLREAGHYTDPLRGGGILFTMFDNACRARSAAAYERLLTADPPAEILRAALRDLREVREAGRIEPRLLNWSESWYWLEETLIDRIRQQHGYSRNFSSDFTELEQVRNAAMAIVELRDRIADPALRRRAEALHRRYPQADPDDLGPYRAQSGADLLKWTGRPALAKCLRQVIEKESGVVAAVLLPELQTERIDPWTAVVMSCAARRVAFQVSYSNIRMNVTRHRLIELAFAARIYQLERGRWPERAEDLVPDYLPAEPAASQPATPAGTFRHPNTATYEPLRLAERELTPALKTALFAVALPIRSLDSLNTTHGPHPPVVNDSQIDQFVAGNNNTQFALLQAVRESMLMHPRLVESAEILLQSEMNKYDDVGAKPGASPPPGAEKWVSLDEAVRDGLAQPPDPNRPESGWELSRPRLLRLKARLRAPDRALVAWSPGPDGDDDNAKTVYDPTNGTRSDGDILVFPEPY